MEHPAQPWTIDLVIAATPDQLRAFGKSLSTSAYYVELETALEAYERESMFNLIDLTTGWKVDLIFRKSRPFSKEEFARRKLANIEGFLCTWPASKM